MRRANEEWRYDPERRRAAADLYLGWVQAVLRAEGHLRAAEAAFRDLSLPEQDPGAALARRVLGGIQQALRAAADSPRGIPSPTLVGNMAAFGIGYEHEDEDG